MICSTCGSQNAAHLTYCQTCGQRLLAKAAAPTPPAGVDASALLEAAEAIARKHAPIEPARVVALRELPPSAGTSQVCARCKTLSETGSQFCVACGAPLGVDARAPASVSQTAQPPSMHAGSNAATRAGPRIILIARDGSEGPSFPLADQVDIGRSEGEVKIDDPYLSPRHARILSKESSLIVRDLDSLNGLYLRLRKSKTPGDPHSDERPLSDQDLILVGQQVIRLEIVNDLEQGCGQAQERGTLVFGTPVTARYGRLALRSVEGITRDVFYLRRQETVIGREGTDVVFADDPFVSRRHAAVTRTASGFSVKDLGSSNGTFVRIRQEVALVDGDEFRVGQQLFRVSAPRSET